MNETNAVKSYAALPHILVIDDDTRIRDLIARYLYEHGFMVMSAPDAAVARDILDHFSFDAMVVDVMMPGEGGLNFTRFVRNTLNVPVILLTALGEANDRIKGLESGADDYLAKPFEPRELVLRLQALIRRSGTPDNTDKPTNIGEWRFDPKRRELVSDQATITLTTGETTLLSTLCRTPGQIISRENLAKACDIDPHSRNVDVQITRLRRKLETDTRRPRYLQTVRGKGYVIHI